MSQLWFLLQCMDFGYHNSVRCTMMMYQSCHKNISKTHQNAIEVINKCVNDLDSQTDKQRFIELYNAAFMLPKKFDFQPCKGDEVTILLVHGLRYNRLKKLSNSPIFCEKHAYFSLNPIFTPFLLVCCVNLQVFQIHGCNL